MGRRPLDLDAFSTQSKKSKNNVRVVNKQNLNKILKSNIHSQQAMEGIMMQIKSEKGDDQQSTLSKKIDDGMLDRIFDG